jgi:hypothetical protein
MAAAETGERFPGLRGGRAVAERQAMGRHQEGTEAGVPRAVTEAIAELKTRIVGARRLEEVWDHFVDSLATNEAFIELGEPAQHPGLWQVVEAVVPRALKQSGRLVDLRLQHSSAEGLWHGAGLFEAAMCVVLFFEPEDRGLLCISRPLFLGSVIFARFSLTPLPKHAFPIRRPDPAV